MSKPNPDWIGAYFMPADHELMLTDEEERALKRERIPTGYAMMNLRLIEASERPFQPWTGWLRGQLQNLNWLLLGYSLFRIKRWLGIRQVPKVHVGEGPARGKE